MPRRARRILESGYLHLIVQGINRECIFERGSNIKRYYDLLVSKREESEVDILAYCIMSNHAHILVYADKIENVSRYMKKVNTAYATYYNKQTNRVGYVFRDRYKSKAVKDEWYLYNCISYIHYNPVKAGMVNEPSEYKYSSFNDFYSKTGVVSNKTLKLIFGGIKHYKEMFDFIHSIDVNDADMEKKDNGENYLCDIDISDKEKLKEECIKLKQKNMSNRKIALMIGIDRNKVDRILK